MHSLSKIIKSLFMFTLLLGLLSITENRGKANGKNMKSLFEVKYSAWCGWLRENRTLKPSSIIDVNRLYDNEPFREIVKLGVPAVPYIIEKQQEDHILGYALYKITKWKWHTTREGKDPNEWVWTVEEFPNIREKHGPPDSRKIWLRWWKEGQKLTDTRFEKLYREWQELKNQNKDKQAKEKRQRIVDLGIAALPKIMKKIEGGDTALIKDVSKLTDKKIKDNAIKSECIEWWKINKEKWLISFPKPTIDPNKPSAKHSL